MDEEKGSKTAAFASLEDEPISSSAASEKLDSYAEAGAGGHDDFISVGADSTALALDKCEKYVLQPYRMILKLLGWTPLTRYGDSALYKFLRVLLVGFWLTIIFITFITQILSCFRRDTPLPAPKMMVENGTDVRVITCEQHVISAFVLTDILLLSSYLFGLYLFSREETEYLSNLASKVFIKSVSQETSNNQKAPSNQLVYTIVAYFFCGIVWVVLSLLVRIMTTASVEMWSDNTIIVWSNGTDHSTTFRGAGKVVLIILDLIGFLFFDLVYVAAVMNYAAQSEMNIYHLSAIRKLVQDKRYGENGLDASIKDIIESRKYLRVLNGKTATATALILFNLGSAGIAAIINLDKISSSNVQDFNVELATVTAGFNVILWIGLVSFPFIQAARVTDYCLQLKAVGPELRARPQLYAQTPQLELDSYVTLTHAVKLRATMFGIPIYPWMWWAAFSAMTFLALLLFQNNVYSFTIYL